MRAAGSIADTTEANVAGKGLKPAVSISNQSMLSWENAPMHEVASASEEAACSKLRKMSE